MKLFTSVRKNIFLLTFILTYKHTNDKTYKSEGIQLIYLDYAATTPMSSEALHVYNEAVKKYFGNASSLHDIGTKANDALTICRRQLAMFLNGEEKGIYFTSGGTEANVLAILSLIKGNKKKGNHLITTKVEHSSLFNLFQQLEKEEGYEVTYLSVDTSGFICLDELQKAIRPTTILASIHHGNSEIGTMQSIKQIGEILHQSGVIFHSDCVQTFGEIEIDVIASKIDSLSVSSHKIYGPKGTGFCYISPKVNWKMQINNTTHEDGFRAGTVDVPSILSFTTAAQQMMQTMEKRQEKYKMLRDRLITYLNEKTDKVIVEGSMEHQLAHIIGLSFLQVQGQYIMLECNRYGIAISTGTACQVGMQSPSRTMLAIGKAESEAKQFIRISLGKMTTESEIDQTIEVLERILQNLS